jgi:hypothetical protein
VKQRQSHRKIVSAANMRLTDLIAKTFKTIGKDRTRLAVLSPKLYYDFFHIKLGR